jgi:hypothetical protein
MADDIERQAGTEPETEGGGEAQGASAEQAAGGQDVDSGHRDVIGGRTGVHRLDDEDQLDRDMPIRMAGEWGQGERGGAGYWDAGTSEGSPAGSVQELLGSSPDALVEPPLGGPGEEPSGEPGEEPPDLTRPALPPP